MSLSFFSCRYKTMWEILGTKVRFLDYPTKPFVGKTVDTPIKTCAVTGVTGVTGGAGCVKRKRERKKKRALPQSGSALYGEEP